jgi:hypothetical protein
VDHGDGAHSLPLRDPIGFFACAHALAFVPGLFPFAEDKFRRPSAD